MPKIKGIPDQACRSTHGESQLRSELCRRELGHLGRADTTELHKPFGARQCRATGLGALDDAVQVGPMGRRLDEPNLCSVGQRPSARDESQCRICVENA